jgi:hypothetical protein
VALEEEIYSSYGLDVPPIERDPDLPGQSSDRGRGLNSEIQRFVDLFVMLLKHDRVAALQEFEAWPQNDDPVFGRLRVWAAGLPGFLDPYAASRVLLDVSDSVFWGQSHQRDLLLTLARRWSAIPETARKKLQTRLRKGPANKRRYDKANFAIYRAYSIVDRLSWLRNHSCQFDFDVGAVIAKARLAIPDGSEPDGSHAADSMEGRGGSVHTDDSHAEFTDTSINSLIVDALAAQDHRHGFLEERDPYAGLVKDRPLRVLAGLRHLEETSPLAQQAWAIFLQSAARLDDKARLTVLIARRLVATHPNLLEKLLLPVSSWLDNSAKRLIEVDRKAADTLFERLLAIILADAQRVATAVARNADRDWLEEGLNSPVGRLVAVLFADPELADSTKVALPPTWTKRAESLLELPGDQGSFALARFARELGWFFVRDPAWAEEQIVAAIDRDGANRDAMLAGFFSNAKMNGELFLRLKPTLFTLAISEVPGTKRREGVLASLFISGWQAKNEEGARYVTDDELRAVIVHGTEEMRTRMLWHVGHWQLDDKLTLLSEVWPLQLAARSATISGRLLSLIFDNEENFAALADAALPLLSPIVNRDFLSGILYRDRMRVINRYPRKVLAILLEVVPDPPAELPHVIGELLSSLLMADPGLAKDHRFGELRRRQIALQ